MKKNAKYFLFALIVSCSQKTEQEASAECEGISEISSEYFGDVLLDTTEANECLSKISKALACKELSKADKEMVLKKQAAILGTKDTLIRESDKDFSEEEINAFAKGMRVKYDDMTNKYRIEHPTSPKYVDYNGTFFSIVYVKKERPILAFNFQYHGDEWLFIENLSLKIDDVKYGAYPKDVSTDVGGGVSEWFTVVADRYVWRNKITKDSKIKIRINGREFYKDIELTKQQISAMVEINDIFNKMQEAR